MHEHTVVPIVSNYMYMFFNIPECTRFRSRYVLCQIAATYGGLIKKGQTEEYEYF